MNLEVCVVVVPQVLFRQVNHLGHDVDAVYVTRLTDELREQASEPTRAATDFEHALTGLHAQVLQHDGDGGGLGDGLIVANGQRRIIVGLVVQFLVYKITAPHLLEGSDDGIGVEHAFPNEFLNERVVHECKYSTRPQPA